MNKIKHSVKTLLIVYDNVKNMAISLCLMFAIEWSKGDNWCIYNFLNFNHVTGQQIFWQREIVIKEDILKSLQYHKMIATVSLVHKKILNRHVSSIFTSSFMLTFWF